MRSPLSQLSLLHGNTRLGLSEIRGAKGIAAYDPAYLGVCSWQRGTHGNFHISCPNCIWFTSQLASRTWASHARGAAARPSHESVKTVTAGLVSTKLQACQNSCCALQVCGRSGRCNACMRAGGPLGAICVTSAGRVTAPVLQLDASWPENWTGEEERPLSCPCLLSACLLTSPQSGKQAERWQLSWQPRCNTAQPFRITPKNVSGAQSSNKNQNVFKKNKLNTCVVTIM